MLLLLISFIAGVLTVLAPCILPLLPVIVGGSLSGEGFHKKKALTIVISLGLSVIVFTFLLKVSTLFINIPESTWMWISGGIIVILGLITIFPSLWENKFLARMSAKSNILLGKGEQKQSFWGDVIIGGALGPVFSTCSPTYFIVLATVLPASPIVGFVYLLAYAVGLALSLFIIALVGQKIMIKLNIAADPRGTFKRVLGVLFVLVGLTIITGADKKIEANLLESGFFDVTKIEQRLLEFNKSPAENVMIENQTDNSSSTSSDEASSSLTFKDDQKPISTQEKNKSSINVMADLAKKAALYQKSPEISTPDGFVNTGGKPITIGEFKGKKVVLLDIWTYSCINCQRTLPYVNSWYEKYNDQGLEIIGLHTPEFSFEKVLSNVERAVGDFNIKYPVVLDNDYSTWNALGNQYWPRKYLIDIDGYIVYDHIGEGGYDETEKAIQKALKERADRLSIKEDMPQSISAPANVISIDSAKVGSPEVYFGSARNQYLSNGKQGLAGSQTLTIPDSISANNLYLGGTWNFSDEFAENQNSGDVIFKYSAKNVYIVASADSSTEVEIWEDGALLKKIFIKDEQLYPIIEGGSYGSHILELKINSGKIKAFTLTFG